MGVPRDRWCGRQCAFGSPEPGLCGGYAPNEPVPISAGHFPSGTLRYIITENNLHLVKHMVVLRRCPVLPLDICDIFPSLLELDLGP